MPIERGECLLFFKKRLESYFPLAWKESGVSVGFRDDYCFLFLSSVKKEGSDGMEDLPSSSED